MITDTVKTLDIEMEYFSFGTGKRSLVILPGLSARSVLVTAKAIQAAYSCFGEDFTVYVFDRRKNMPDDYTIRDMADDTAAVMRALGISRADIFGTSQGGMIAQCIAIAHPGLTRSLVLGSTSARTDGVDTGIQRWVELAEMRDLTALTESFIDMLFSPETIGKFKELLLHMNDGLTDEDLRRFIIGARAIENFDVREELSAVKCPAFVIGARGDKVLPAELSVELAELLCAELYLYGEEYAHCVFDEAPDYKQRMMEFLQKN